MRDRAHLGPMLAAGILLGAGLGGFADGITLHQIAQWHNMLSSVVPVTDLVSSKINMFWDGVFHAGTWIATVLGLGLLWRASRREDVPWSGRLLFGAMLMGWGLFNVVEGIIDHQILGIHHVRPGEGQLSWDLGFIAFGLFLLLGGALLARTWRYSPTDRPLRRPRGVVETPA
jgi:uncharacterized membrane protein